jgi:hypothetical protein
MEIKSATSEGIPFVHAWIYSMNPDYEESDHSFSWAKALIIMAISSHLLKGWGYSNSNSYRALAQRLPLFYRTYQFHSRVIKFFYFRTSLNASNERT